MSSLAPNLDLSKSPIRIARKSKGLGIREAAVKAGITRHVWYLAECGVFTNIPPSIENFLYLNGFDVSDLSKSYLNFLTEKREAFGRALGKEVREYLIYKESGGASLSGLREALGLSRQSFSKRLGVQPAVLWNVETGRQRYLPMQVREALEQAGIEKKLILRLELGVLNGNE